MEFVNYTEDDFARAIENARRLADERFPNATTVFLGGSWASGTAHADSDLDIVVIDETAATVSFEGIEFQNGIVEVCVIPPSRAATFFQESAKYRSAPVPAQVAKGLLIKGKTHYADEIRRIAEDVLAKGPVPLTEAELLELRYDITLLREDLAHASPDAFISLGALAHTQLSRAFLDMKGAWRAERKALRHAVVSIGAEFALQLDEALAQACAGNVQPMITLCTEVLSRLGGSCRTYPLFSI